MREEELNALGIVWEPRDDDWERGFAVADAYRFQRGHLRVPASHLTEHGFKLGAWISRRRGDRRRGRLSPDRVAALDAIGMVWEAVGDQWEKQLAAARGYSETHGDLRVPQKYRTQEGEPLGFWTTTWRRDRRRGKLDSERIVALDAIGMERDPLDADWLRGVAACRDYRDLNGHLRAPNSFVSEDGFPLGSCLNSRRAARKRGTLSDERVAELDALGMAWEPLEETWQRGVAACRAFRERNGHLEVRVSFVSEDGFALGAWLNRCRGNRARGTLSAERVAELDALGMAWKAREGPPPRRRSTVGPR